MCDVFASAGRRMVVPVQTLKDRVEKLMNSFKVESDIIHRS